MDSKDIFRKKLLLPLAYACVVAVALWGATAMVPDIYRPQDDLPSPISSPAPFRGIEPAAGESTEQAPQPDTNLPESKGLNVSQIQEIPPIPESEVVEPPSFETEHQAAPDAPEAAPLRISPDKPEIVALDRAAVNVLVGNDENLRAVPDTNKTVILIPKKPGATYFKALDADGRVIMQRHVIVGAPKSDYIRIRRACINGQEGCKQYSVYYCPDTCHEVNVMQDEKKTANDAAPKETAAAPATQNPDNPDNPDAPQNTQGQ